MATVLEVAAHHRPSSIHHPPPPTKLYALSFFVLSVRPSVTFVTYLNPCVGMVTACACAPRNRRDLLSEAEEL